MTLPEEIEFWSDEAEKASSRELAMFALGAKAGLQFARDDHLGRLAQAIIDNTQGDLFWIGEILLAELEKETGYRHKQSSR